MNVLAIESSTSQGGIAVRYSSGPIREILLEQGMVHGRDLAGAIQSALSADEPRTLDLIVCDIGPGSYTGLRVGITYARTLSWALKIPAVGAVSLDALALAYARAHPELPEGTRIVPAMDAKWGQVYMATYEVRESRPRRLGDPWAAPPDKALEGCHGARVFGDASGFFSNSDPDPRFSHPRPGAILELGVLQADKAPADTPIGIAPLYLRPAIIKG